ncbi:helix-turn-helix domain-containing protein [Lacticaseibacillus sp. 866-1]|uniref:helix-turn-helix domain-containing protein n=1 Tax=Lacticaseibacillus sp. 866-1 TaxID=2799576 RepID=UPI001944D5C1|nr:helix-turn-helix domain-containing protein [Lacticaseibacillus sp. 866-1]
MEKRLMPMMVYLCVNGSKYVSREKMCAKFGISERTLRQTMSEVAVILEQNGLQLEKRANLGYRILSDDTDAFHAFAAKLRLRSGLQQPGAQIVANRTNYILYTLLRMNQYITIEHLCERLYLSRSQINESIKQMRRILSQFALRLNVKPGYGICISGGEWSRRRCWLALMQSDHRLLTQILMNNQSLHEQYKRANQELRLALFKGGLLVLDGQAETLLHYLFLTRVRLHDGDTLTDFSNLEGEDSIHAVAKLLLPEAQEAEINALQAVLKGTTINPKELSQPSEIEHEFWKIINKRDYGLSFSTQERTEIAWQLQLLERRILTGLFRPFSELTDFRVRDFATFELLNAFQQRLQTIYQAHVAMIELGVLTFFLEPKMAERVATVTRKKVAVTTTFGTVGLSRLKHFLAASAGDTEIKVTAYDFQQLNYETAQEQFDIVFSNYSLPDEDINPGNVIRLSPQLDTGDKQLVEAALKRSGVSKNITDLLSKQQFSFVKNFEMLANNKTFAKKALSDNQLIPYSGGMAFIRRENDQTPFLVEFQEPLLLAGQEINFVLELPILNSNVTQMLEFAQLMTYLFGGGVRHGVVSYEKLVASLTTKKY